MSRLLSARIGVMLQLDCLSARVRGSLIKSVHSILDDVYYKDVITVYVC